MTTATAATITRLTRLKLKLVALVRAPESRPAHTNRRRKAAGALACGVLVAVAAQFGLGWAVETDRTPLRDPIYLDKLELIRTRPGFVRSEVAPHEKPLALAFLGSSRSLDAIDAGAVGPELTRALGKPVEAFNFAHPGAGPVVTALYLRRLLNDGVKPDAVMIEVHPALLAARDDPPEANWFPPVRLRPEEVHTARRLGFNIAPPDAHGWRGRYLPWYAYRVPLIDRYATHLTTHPFPVAARQPSDEFGFLRCRTVSPDERARLLVLTQKQYADYMPNYRPGGSGLRAIRDALETCHTANVRAALVITPESTEFRSWYPEPGRARIAPVLSELAREFGAPFFDCREWLPDELIGDGHHLTGPGADAFTAKLTRDALVPWLGGKTP